MRFPSLIAAICFCVAPVSAAMAQSGAGGQTAPVEKTSVPAKERYSVFFDYNSAELSPDAVGVVGKAARLVKDAKDGGATHVTVIGHTDTYLPDAYSVELSQRRADVVRDALVRAGVNPEAITTVAKGKTELLVDTPDGMKEAQNRRATIIVK